MKAKDPDRCGLCGIEIGPKTLRMRRALSKAGWVATHDGHWISPSGEPFGSLHFSYRVMLMRARLKAKKR